MPQCEDGTMVIQVSSERTAAHLEGADSCSKMPPAWICPSIHPVPHAACVHMMVAGPVGAQPNQIITLPSKGSPSYGEMCSELLGADNRSVERGLREWREAVGILRGP